MLNTLKVLVATTGIFALGGCTYDYLQHSDRVAYSAGEAVKTNQAIQTTNPSKKSMNSVSGLGKNGVVVPDANVATDTGAGPMPVGAP